MMSPIRGFLHLLLYFLFPAFPFESFLKCPSSLLKFSIISTMLSTFTTRSLYVNLILQTALSLDSALFFLFHVSIIIGWKLGFMIMKVKCLENDMPFLLLAFTVGHWNQSSHELSGLVLLLSCGLLLSWP